MDCRKLVFCLRALKIHLLNLGISVHLESTILLAVYADFTHLKAYFLMAALLVAYDVRGYKPAGRRKEPWNLRPRFDCDGAGQWNAESYFRLS